MEGYTQSQSNQVVIRTVRVNEAGMGAVIAQLRKSVAIASMLGAEFATFSVPSEHTYQVASYMNFDSISVGLPADAKVCSLTILMNTERVTTLVNSWCGGKADFEDSEAVEMRKKFQECGIILDDSPWNVQLNLWKCTRPWMRRIVYKSLAKQQGLPSIPITESPTGIGLHIRWGDMAKGDFKGDPKTAERSTPIPVAARLLRKLRECGVKDELKIYMENHNTTMLADLKQKFRIIDTRNDLADLVDLASNQIMILAHGSYAYMAHQIAEGRLTVVPDAPLQGLPHWHFSDNGVGNILRWKELLDISCANLLEILHRPH